LALRVNVDVIVSLSFGLEILASVVVPFAKEVFMNNSFVQSCVWCGVAFLRGHSGTLPTQARGYQSQKRLLSQEKRRGVRVPSLAPLLGWDFMPQPNNSLQPTQNRYAVSVG